LVALPNTQNLIEESVSEFSVQQSRNEEQIGKQSGLENNGHVGSVEQLNGVRLNVSGDILVVDGNINLKSLEEIDHHENSNSGGDIVQIGEIFPQKSMFEGRKYSFISPENSVEKSNKSPFIFLSIFHKRKTFPQQFLANIGGNEERNGGNQSISSLLQNFVQQIDDDRGSNQLEHNQEGLDGSDVFDFSVNSGKNVSNCLESGNNDGEQFLSGIDQLFVFLVFLIDLDYLGADQQLHDHSGSDNGTNSQLHQSPSVGGHDDSGPVHGVVSGHVTNSVERNLRTDQENEESEDGPEQLVLEGNEQTGRLHFGDELEDRSQVG